jgi:predicted DNA-binding transcriptional regulator AlpA
MSMLMSEGDGRPALLTVPDVLREIRVSRAFFYKMVKAGKGPRLTKLGDRTLVSAENLSDWLAQREVGPEPRVA